METPPAATHPEPRSGWKFALPVVLCVAAVAFLVTAPLLLRKPANTDEWIYLSLAASLAEGRDYTLQGTRLLELLPKEMYDHPVFNHPPGFPWLLVPFVNPTNPAMAMIVPVLSFFLAAFAVAFAARHFLFSASAPPSAKFLFCLVVIAAFFDPLLGFCARRVWMDGPLAAWIAWAFVPLLTGRPGVKGLAFSGLCFAGAVGTKILMVAFLVPVVAFLLWRSRSRWRDVFLVGLPPAIVFALWEAMFFRATGTWFPNWLTIDPAIFALFPYLAARAEQPVIFFPWRLFVLMPLSFLTLAAAGWLLGKRRKSLSAWPVGLLLLASVVFYIGLLVVLGERGFSKEARYLAPAIPLLLMLFAWVLQNVANRTCDTAVQFYLLLCGLAVIAGAMISGIYFAAWAVDEPLSLWELLDQVVQAQR